MRSNPDVEHPRCWALYEENDHIFCIGNITQELKYLFWSVFGCYSNAQMWWDAHDT